MNIPSGNPWVNLPDTPPFIAPDDAELVDRFSRRRQRDCALKLDLPPQPWTGSPAVAEVFALALNPGHSPQDYEDFRDPDYAGQWRLALTFSTRIPFYFLDPAFRGTAGYQYWACRFRDLSQVVGIEAVARKIIIVEHFPYKSIKYRSLGKNLPSQEYSFALVRAALNAGKQIVVMRSERVWLDSVPELRCYPYVRLSSNQNPYFSRAQMTPAQFERLVAALRD